MDGVIKDTARFHFLAWKKLADKLGYYFDEKVNERLKGVSRSRSFEIILEVNNAMYKYSTAEKEAFCTEKNEIYKELIKQLTPDDVLPGIREFMDKASAAGIKTAVASVSKNARDVLAYLGMADSFDYIADAKKITKSKPDPEIFLVCAEELGVLPEDCIGIEDAQAGIEAIHNAGMLSIGINVDVTSLSPDISLSSTSELDFDSLVK